MVLRRIERLQKESTVEKLEGPIYREPGRRGRYISEVHGERTNFRAGLTELIMSEHEHLDKDGGTTKIEETIDTGIDVFGSCKEALRRYSYLFDKYPTRPQHELSTWEYSSWTTEEAL